MRPVLLAALLCIPLAAQAAAPGPPSLHLVGKIQIGELDHNRDWTKPLRQNLRTELQAAGFQIVDQPSDADAVLAEVRHD